MSKEFAKARRGFKGELSLPGDKSITHRALIFNSIAKGRCKIENPSPAADCRSTLQCLIQLGARIENYSTGGYTVDGTGRFGLKEPDNVLFAGNSGTTARILPALLAGQRFTSFLTGDDSLRKRPMDRVIDPLQMMGASIFGRGQNKFLPLCIKGGNLNGIRFEMPVASAQVKSAVILAALLAEGESVILEPLASRNHTELMLAHMGASISISGKEITVSPGEINAVDIVIPGDISSAAFFIAASTCIDKSEIVLRDVGLNPTRIGFLNVLKEMGAQIELELSDKFYEPAGNIIVKHSNLKGTIIDKNIPEMIDELPVIAVLATQADGRTEIRNAGELRIKESDRISAIAAELKKMEANIEELEDGWVIEGPSKLKGATISSYNDHRMAMSLAIAALLAEGRTVIEGFDCIDVSYPDFYKDLSLLAGEN